MADRPSERDKSLMERFLESAEDYSNEEVGNWIDLSGERIRQYRAGEWQTLQAETRRKMEKHLEDEAAATSPTYAEGKLDAILEMREKLSEMWSRLRRAAPETVADDLEATLEKRRREGGQTGSGDGGGRGK